MSKLTAILTAISAALIAIFTAFMRGKRAGKQQSEAKQNEATIENIQAAAQAENETAALLANPIERKRLRAKWNAKS
jgi:hypothetical protein